MNKHSYSFKLHKLQFVYTIALKFVNLITLGWMCLSCQSIRDMNFKGEKC